MNRTLKIFMAIFLSLIFFTTLISLSCQTQKPVAKKTIKIGINLDFTGPTAANSTALLLKSAQDYIKYINDTEGGLKGTKLEILWADSGYNIQRMLSNYARFKEAGTSIVMIQVSQEAFVLKPIAERDHMPAFTHAVDANAYSPPGWIYTAGGGSTPEFFAVFLKWLKDNWKETRAPRIAIIGWDNTLGRAPQAASKLIEETKVEIVAQEYLPVVTMDFSSYLLRINKASPDYIFVGVAAAGMGPLLRDAERLGIRGKIPIISNGVVPMYSFTGAAGELLDGLISFHGRIPPFEPNVEGINKMKNIYQKINGKAYYDNGEDAYGYLWGWIEIMVPVEIIKQTIERVGLDNLNGESIKSTLDKGARVETGGITKALSYGSEKRRGNDYARMIQVRKGNYIPVSDWIEMPSIKE